MEEFDELLPTADANGSLDLSHRAWKEVNDIVWTMGREVSSLLLGYNRLTHLPCVWLSLSLPATTLCTLNAHRLELGDLKLLRVLDCSCNQIELLPACIGVLRSLVKLKCNGNKLVSLPEEVGMCCALEELICSENQLITLPRSLGRLDRLHTLLVQNNALEMLPPTLADAAGALRVINCRNNPGLRMIPKQIGDDAKLILWVLKLHRESEIECQQIVQCNRQLERLCDLAQQRNAQLTAQLQNCNQERLDLLRNAPTGFCRLNFACKCTVQRCRQACIAM